MEISGPPGYLSPMSKPPSTGTGAQPAPTATSDAAPAPKKKPAQKDEHGGPAWPEPTRYGDWERGGKVSDF